ncbi:MAG: hypothetical protein GC146_07510 [Limimaricola sp.]|uniref:hypothetical protein n=1 Tax=Limimaricola sp. TaxID=2211665 RepID=UPI001D327945|nr:hypothetical protein [Limimaricola sp.]MBI1417051.1 hypothetical protein [Limimaricola sp.]
MRKIALVTGMPRSGTTVIGERLTIPPAIKELYEPLNPEVGIRLARETFPLCGEGALDRDQLSALLENIAKVRLPTPMPRPGSARSVLFNRTRRTIWGLKFSRASTTVIWKDPFAAFLADSVARRSDIPVIFTLRGPLETAASFARMDWALDVSRLRERMQTAGYPTTSWPEAAPELRAAVVSAAQLWALIHVNVEYWMKTDTKITFVRIEDNIEAPEKLGAFIAQATGLDVKPAVPAITSPQDGDAPDLPTKAHVRNRSAASITDYWRRTLTDAEIDYVSSFTAERWGRIRSATGLTGKASN